MTERARLLQKLQELYKQQREITQKVNGLEQTLLDYDKSSMNHPTDMVSAEHLSLIPVSDILMM